jgi:phosphoribosylglycinamide formyltransferase-1
MTQGAIPGGAMTKGARLRVAVLVSGSGTNLQAIINATDNGTLPIEIVGVVSDRPDAFGLQRARDAGIEAIAVDFRAAASRAEYNRRLDDELARLNPDLVVLAGYMRILPAKTVNDFRGRMLNVHPSLLPAYPGLDTHARVLAAGEQWHGTTVHFVTPELDAGPGILQYRVKIHTDDTEKSLRERVQKGEYLIYPQVINWIADGRVKLANDCVVLDGQRLNNPSVIAEP